MNDQLVTDEQLWAESPGIGSAPGCLVDESITSDFCPYQHIHCIGWVDGQCQLNQCVLAEAI